MSIVVSLRRMHYITSSLEQFSTQTLAVVADWRLHNPCPSFPRYHQLHLTMIHISNLVSNQL